MNHLTPYEQRSFNEKFNGAQKCAILYLAPDGSLAYNSDCIDKPHHALMKFIRQGNVYAINPIHNNKTNLIWFDVDNHDGSVDADGIAKRIYDELASLGFAPEWAKSSITSHHICLWSKIPQSTAYCEIVQGRLLEHLGVSCEFGPMNGKKLRPYFMGNQFKAKGSLLIEGKQCETFGLLRKFYKPRSYSKSSTPSNDRVFDIQNYIPTGGNRHRLMLALCRDMGNKGYKPIDILKASEEIYDRGVVHDSKEKHLKDTASAIKGFRPLPNLIPKKDWKKFWSSVPQGLSLNDLFLKMADFASPLKAFPVQCRDVAMYFKKSGIRGYSRSSVSRKLAMSSYVVLVKKGYSYYGNGDASLYKLREPSQEKTLKKDKILSPIHSPITSF